MTSVVYAGIQSLCRWQTNLIKPRAPSWPQRWRSELVPWRKDSTVLVAVSSGDIAVTLLLRPWTHATTTASRLFPFVEADSCSPGLSEAGAIACDQPIEHIKNLHVIVDQTPYVNRLQGPLAYRVEASAECWVDHVALVD
jgi:hypothetical protein